MLIMNIDHASGCIDLGHDKPFQKVIYLDTLENMSESLKTRCSR